MRSNGTKLSESERGVWFPYKLPGICTPHFNREYALRGGKRFCEAQADTPGFSYQERNSGCARTRAAEHRPITARAVPSPAAGEGQRRMLSEAARRLAASSAAHVSVHALHFHKQLSLSQPESQSARQLEPRARAQLGLQATRAQAAK